MFEGLLVLAITLLLTIIGSVVASRLQQRAWERQYRLSVEDAQLRRAQSLADEIIKQCDQRVHFQRRLFWAIRSPDRFDKEYALAKYSSALTTWEANFGYIRTNLLSLYGYGKVRYFEDHIHLEFQRTGELIESAFRSGDQRSLRSVEKRLSQLSVACYQFTNGLQAPIRERSLPRFENIHELSFDNIDNLDSMYLVKRLYGVSSQQRRV